MSDAEGAGRIVDILRTATRAQMAQKFENSARVTYAQIMRLAVFDPHRDALVDLYNEQVGAIMAYTGDTLEAITERIQRT